jgi:hypothetical protein
MTPVQQMTSTRLCTQVFVMPMDKMSSGHMITMMQRPFLEYCGKFLNVAKNINTLVIIIHVLQFHKWSCGMENFVLFGL